MVHTRPWTLALSLLLVVPAPALSGQAADRDDDRILLVIGAGHVRMLRDLLELAPQYCPVSPLPWLPDDGGDG